MFQVSNIKQRFFFGLVILNFGFFSLFCAAEETLTQDQANSQILSAANYKANECGAPIPDPYLYVISPKVPQRNIDLCSIAIIRSNCPFDAFPQVCILIYLDELGEIPPFINFGDLINAQTR
jgi:hypothetical protein